MDTDVITKVHDLHLTAPLNHEKLSPLVSNPIPTLKLKKSFVLSNSPEHQPSCKASIRTVRARLSLCKKPSNIPPEILNPKNLRQSGQLPPSAHRRADSETHARHPSPSKDDSSASRQKKDLSQEQTIKSAIEKSSALKELLRPPNMHKRAPSGGIPVMPKAGISLNSLAMANEYSKKSIDPASTKDCQSKDSHEQTSYKYLEAIKAAVFSENKNRMGLHQKRLFAQKEKTSNLEALFTPKTNVRHNESPPRQSTKTLFSPELQMLKEALGQQLPGNSFQESSINDPNSTKTVIKLPANRENQLHRALGSASRQSRKRGASGERSSILVNISGEKESPAKKESMVLLEQIMSRNMSGKDKEMPKVTKEEEAKSEKNRNERVKAVEEELQYFKEFLEVEKQTFEFEKAMAAQRSKAKTRKESMYISVASPSARTRQNESQRKLHERSGEARHKEGEMGPFSLYARDAKDVAALTGDSSKNGQGSTTCSSSKLSKELSALRREQSFGFGEAVKVMDVDEIKRRKKSRIVSKSSFKQE